jgi:FkbH-like protein
MTTALTADPRAVLADPKSPLGKTMQAIDELEASGPFISETSLGVSSNVTIDLLGVFLRKHAALRGVRLRIRPGSHDNLLGDVDEFVRDDVDTILLHPFFDNLLPSFESQLGHLARDVIDAKGEDVRARYRLAFEKTRGVRSVFVSAFHRMSARVELAGHVELTDRVGEIIATFNRILYDEASAFPNVKLIDTDDIVRAIGHANAIDQRFYFRGKAPYSTAFLNELARRLAAATRGFGTHFCKALVVDCDNTLWGGVIGEDFVEGIELGPHDYPGNIFWRVQNDLVALEQAGVLLCLCSKNNPEDVDDALARHPETVLKGRHFILKRVNWKDKVTNLREIAETLNIGLDSLVYLDDSDFECSAIRSQLPMVHTFKVPDSLPEYPAVIDQIKELFLAGGVSSESRAKTEQYRQRAEAERSKASFASNEEFLASLGLQVDVSRNAFGSIPRISELTMKSNQFNVTTRRYSVTEIRDFMESGSATVYSFGVRDKFGNAGLTGVLIVQWDGDAAVIDSFLMSCRVIGRGIEFAIWREILRDAAGRGCRVLRTEYRRSGKNAQVADFFDRLGLPLVSSDSGGRRYEVPLEEFPAQHAPWVEVLRGE